MKTLHWRHTDWTARHFVFLIGRQIIGRLSFKSSWAFNAVYTDKETRMKFSQKGFWGRDVVITKDGNAIGEVRKDFFFGKPTLKLPTGETFILSSNLWGRDVCWKTPKGETIVNYRQATISTMGKGLIPVNDSLTSETEKILIGSGLFVRQLVRKRMVLLLVIMIPILAASGR